MRLRKERRGGETIELEVGNLEAMEEPTARSITRSSRRGVKKTKIIAAKALRAEVSASLVGNLETVAASEEEQSKTPSTSQSAGRETKRKRTPWWSAQMSELVANPAAEASKNPPSHAIEEGTRQIASTGNSCIEEDASTAHLSKSVAMSSMGENSTQQSVSIGIKGRSKSRARYLPVTLETPVTEIDRTILAMPRTENEPASLALPALKRTRAERGSLAMPGTELARNDPAAIAVPATELSMSEPATLFVPVLQSASSPRQSSMNGALHHYKPPSATGQILSVDSDEEVSLDGPSISQNSPTSPRGHCGDTSVPPLSSEQFPPGSALHCPSAVSECGGTFRNSAESMNPSNVQGNSVERRGRSFSKNSVVHSNSQFSLNPRDPLIQQFPPLAHPCSQTSSSPESGVLQTVHAVRESPCLRQIGRGALQELNKQKKKTPVDPEQKKKQEKHKRTLRRLRTQVGTKLKTWGLQARLLQEEDGQKAEDVNGTAQSLVLSDKQRDTFIENMVKSCRKDPRMRAEFLDSVHRLARLGVLQTSATQLVAQVACNAAEEIVRAWKEMDAQPKEKTPVPVELYEAVNKLHQQGETAMLSLPPLCKESLCSLGKTSDGAWQVVFPSLGSQKRDNTVERG